MRKNTKTAAIVEMQVGETKEFARKELDSITSLVGRVKFKMNRRYTTERDSERGVLIVKRIS